jgi:hypothetical protein
LLSVGFWRGRLLFFVDGQATGVIEAQKESSTLVGVEIQTQRYEMGSFCFAVKQVSLMAPPFLLS